jgi:hypothetical protein
MLFIFYTAYFLSIGRQFSSCHFQKKQTDLCPSTSTAKVGGWITGAWQCDTALSQPRASQPPRQILACGRPSRPTTSQGPQGVPRAAAAHPHGRSAASTLEGSPPLITSSRCHRDRVSGSSCSPAMTCTSHDLHPLTFLCSDHAPLLLQTDAMFSTKKRFHFKPF